MKSYRSPNGLMLDSSDNSPVDRVLPAHSSVLAAETLRPLGGPVGKHAVVGRQRLWTPWRVVMLFTLLFLCFGFFSKAPCLETTHPETGEASLKWDGRQFYKFCYNDPIPLWGAHGLNKGHFPYKYQWFENDGRERYMEYPVVTGVFQYVNSRIAAVWHSADESDVLPGPIEVIKYFMVTAFILALCWLVAVWATYKLAGRRPWDTLFLAASPLVIFQIFTNFDAVAVMFTMLGVWAWAKKKPVWAGVALGVGAAAKFYPILFIGALIVIGIRHRKLVPVAITFASTIASWLLVNAPIYLLYPKGWQEFYTLNNRRGMNPESLYNVVRHFTPWEGFDKGLAKDAAPAVLNSVSLVLFIACCVGIFILGLMAKRTPRVAQLSFLIIAAFLLTNKVWSPQYSLWLIPFALLAVPRVRVLLPWMAFDGLLWIMHMFFFLGADKKGLDADWFLGAVIVRDLLVVMVCCVIIREILRPAHDLIRSSNPATPVGDDPLVGLIAADEQTERDQAQRAQQLEGGYDHSVNAQDVIAVTEKETTVRA